MKSCGREKSLYVFTAFKMLFLENLLVHVHNLSIFPHTLSIHKKMADTAGNVRAPKRVGGRTKIQNNCEGLSEDVFEGNNLRTPENSDEEDQKTRDNRLQMIRRLQALRWYEYKHIIPCWESLFALKNPW